MKKLLFFIAFLPSVSWAVNVPEFKHKDSIIQREFENVGQEIKKARLLPAASSTPLPLPPGSTNYIQNTGTSSDPAFSVYEGTFTAESPYIPNAVLNTQAASLGQIKISTWNAFVPTGAWNTNCTYTGFWRRIGDSMEIVYQIVLSGAPNSTLLEFDMPSGFSIDQAKTLTGDADGWQQGEGLLLDSGTAFYNARPFSDGADKFRVRYETAGTWNGIGNNTTPFTWASGDKVWMKTVVPISGWGATN